MSWTATTGILTTVDQTQRHGTNGQ